MTTRLLAAAAALCLVLAAGACSDDNGEKQDSGPKQDSGKQDTAVGDTGGGDDIYDPDFGAADLAVDKTVTPDSDPGVPSKWKEMKSSLSAALYAVWPISANNVIAAGASGSILKYDGTSWSTMTSPDTTKSTIRAMHEGGSYLFAVGDTIDLYYNGSIWNLGYKSTSYSYLAVWGSKTGSYMFSLDPGSSYPYIRYRSKSSPTSYWSSIYISSIKDTLYGIWGTSDTNVYVVGDNGLIMSCTGSSSCTSSSYWKTMTSPTTSNLKAIWGSSDKDIFAAGFDGTIIHYDGSTWTKMTTGTSSYFYGIWGSSGTNVFAVGHPIFKSDEAIFRYDGTKWTKMVTPHTTYLEDVRGTSATDVWAVGKTHILHYDGK